MRYRVRKYEGVGYGVWDSLLRGWVPNESDSIGMDEQVAGDLAHALNG